MDTTRADMEALTSEFLRVRATTERLAAPLSPEDQGLQSMPSSSPTKWHRAHTTWFFETFVLVPRGVAAHRPEWSVLFNSYYVALGPRHARPKRGMVSRPSAEAVGDYRAVVDARMVTLLERAGAEAPPQELARLHSLVTLGLAHEEQHQELLLTDILHAFSENPLRPAYRDEAAVIAPSPTTPLSFVAFDGGLHEVGASASEQGFRFDNEEPAHRVFVEPFTLANRPVTVGEWKAFARAGGYQKPELWLSEGFDWVQRNEVRAPLYCTREGESLVAFGLQGTRELHDHEPLSHVSFYEADALARFMGARLPTELEWEVAVRARKLDPRVGNFLDDDALRPLPARERDGVAQCFGDVWEWTASAYSPYPGFRTSEGALGEYNGKFMVNQMVLRGGSCLTPRGHVRASYRNFWHPDTQFQMTGLRLAR